MSHRFDFSNKQAFVLGGNGLIGKETCSLLTELGCDVIVLDKILPKKKVEGFTYNELDITDLDNLEVNFLELLKLHGTPDIFINTSYPRTKDWAKNSFEEISNSSFRTNIDFHLNGFCLSSKIIAESMRKKNIKGSIVMVSSIYGVKAQDMTLYQGTNLKENMSYPVIKSGIIHFAKQMASYYGRDGIRVNTVLPSGLKGKIAGKNQGQNQVFLKRYIERTPLKRMASAEDIAYGIAFLASDAASFITGQDLKIDGGLSII